MPPSPEISVIVPARDSAGTIGPTLDALAAQRGPAHEVIVVDNGSRDDTAEIAERHPAVDRVLRRARGDGPGAARNDGVRAARAPLIAFTDADCVPISEWLAAGVGALRDADLVQGKVVPDPAARPGPFDRTLSIGGAYGLFETANMFIRRSFFEALDGFADPFQAAAQGASVRLAGASRPGVDEAPFGEDVWLGWRAQRAGARSAFSAAALVHHAVFPRGAAGFVAERTRLRFFPALAARVPELRDAFFYRRFFLSPRSAAFDLALATTAATAASGQPLVLIGLAPYLVLLAREACGWGLRKAPVVAVTGIAADAVGCVSLVRGSVASRSLVL